MGIANGCITRLLRSTSGAIFGKQDCGNKACSLVAGFRFSPHRPAPHGAQCSVDWHLTKRGNDMSAHWFMVAEVEHAVEEVEILLEWYRRGYRAESAYADAIEIAEKWGIPLHKY